MENVKWAIKCLQQEQVHLGTNTKWEQLSERNTERHARHSSSNTISVLRDHHAGGLEIHSSTWGFWGFNCIKRSPGWSSSNNGWYALTVGFNVAQYWSSESHSGPSAVLWLEIQKGMRHGLCCHRSHPSIKRKKSKESFQYYRRMHYRGVTLYLYHYFLFLFFGGGGGVGGG